MQMHKIGREGFVHIVTDSMTEHLKSTTNDKNLHCSSGNKRLQLLLSLLSLRISNADEQLQCPFPIPDAAIVSVQIRKKCCNGSNKEFSPESEGDEKAAGPPIQQPPSNLHVEGGPNGASNANQLDMPGFQLPMRAVTDRLEVVGAIIVGRV